VAFTLAVGLYVTPDHPQCVLLSYSGDDTAAVRLPHGNAKTAIRDIVLTQPHVLHDIAQRTGSSGSVYRSLVNSRPSRSEDQPATDEPRDMEQIRNVRKVQRNKSRLTHDAIYNLHEFAADSDFVHKIITHPDLAVTMYSSTALEMFCGLFSEDAPLQTMSYDTTFCLGRSQ